MSSASAPPSAASSASKGKRRQYLSSGAAAKRAKYGAVDLTKGLRGFLITCDQGKEQLCQREVLAWLSDYADALPPPTGEEEEGKGTEEKERTEGGDDEPPAPRSTTVSDALQAELAELQQQRRAPNSRSSKERFIAVDTAVKGLVFVQCRAEAVDHIALLYKMLEDVASTHRLRTRYTIRIHPLHRTCFSNTEALTAVLTPLIQTFLPTLPPDSASSPHTFAVVFNKRSSHEQLQRAAIIELVVSRVGKGWTVDLDDPHVVVLVEVATRMAGVGVVHRWQEMRKFNVRALAEDGEGSHTAAVKKATRQHSKSSKAADADTGKEVEAGADHEGGG